MKGRHNNFRSSSQRKSLEYEDLGLKSKSMMESTQVDGQTINSAGDSPCPGEEHKRKSSFRKWLTTPMRKLSQGKFEKNASTSAGKPERRSVKFFKHLFHGPEDSKHDVPSPASAPLAPQALENSEAINEAPPAEPISPESFTTTRADTNSLLHPPGVLVTDVSLETEQEEKEEAEEEALDVEMMENDVHHHLSQASIEESMMEHEGTTSERSLEQSKGEVKNQEESRNKVLEKRRYVITELVETEKDYVKDLGLIVEGYMKTIQSPDYILPPGMEGKDKIVFGNIHQIYDWHRETFQQELEKCLLDEEKVGSVFMRYERRLYMYVKYCENKPKSEYIVAEYIDFFEELRQKLGHRLQLPDLLIKPVQRIMKYQLLLKDILKHSERAGVDTTDLTRALEVMHVVPKAANDMMNVGRLQGFDGKITAQGKLLLQDRLQVMEVSSRSSKLERSSVKERRVFLFEQIIIFSEVIEKRKNNMSSDGYVFKNSIKINKMGLEMNEEDEDELKFTLIDKTPTSDLKLICQASSEESYKAWTSIIRTLLDIQGDFLRALQSPIAYQKELTKENPDTEFFQPSNMLLRKTNSQPHPSKSTSLLIPLTSPSSSLPSRDGGGRTGGFFGKKQESLKYSRTRSVPSSKQTSSSMKPPKSPHFLLGDTKKKSSGSPQKHTIIDGIRSTLLNLRSKSQEDLHRATFPAHSQPEEPKSRGGEQQPLPPQLLIPPHSSNHAQKSDMECPESVILETHFPVSPADTHFSEIELPLYDSEGLSPSLNLSQCPFIEQPLVDVSVNQGGKAEMVCRFNNLPPPASVEWFGPDDSLIVPNDALLIVTLDENGYSKLQLMNVSMKHEGMYTCTASNPSTTVSTSARLTVVPPAKIMSSPLSSPRVVSTTAG